MKSEGTVHGSQITVHRVPFTVHGSPFTINLFVVIGDEIRRFGSLQNGIGII